MLQDPGAKRPAKRVAERRNKDKGGAKPRPWAGAKGMGWALPVIFGNIM